VGQKHQSMEDKVNALVAYKMAKGLCRKCGDKWHKGHKCADSVQLNVLQEIWDLVQPDSPKDSADTDIAAIEHIFMAISEAAMAGTEAPRTLKIKGGLQNMEILVLIDSGSSHSFVSQQVVAVVSGVTATASPVTVRVADGSVIQAKAEILQAEWFLQGYSFHSDLRVLKLQSFDMIIDMDWLERFSPMQIHWAEKWLIIPYKGSFVTLHGLLHEELQYAMVELFQILKEADSKAGDTVPPVIRQLLQ
jgi:hypothetical protein